MAKMEPIRGEITVKLSQTDRELLKTLMRGLGINPDDEESFADVTVPKFGADNPHIRRLIERQDPAAEPGVLDVTYAGAMPPTAEQRAELRRLLDRRLAEQPQAEGDWLLETERAEAGDDVD